MKKNFLENYNSLTEFEQRLVQLLSLVYSQLDSYKINEINSLLTKYLSPFTTNIDNNTIKKSIDKLKVIGIISNRIINPELSFILNEQSLSSENKLFNQNTEFLNIELSKRAYNFLSVNEDLPLTRLTSICLILNDDTFYTKYAYSLDNIRQLFYNFIRDYKINPQWILTKNQNIQALISSVAIDRFNSFYNNKNISDKKYIEYVHIIKKSNYFIKSEMPLYFKLNLYRVSFLNGDLFTKEKNFAVESIKFDIIMEYRSLRDLNNCDDKTALKKLDSLLNTYQKFGALYDHSKFDLFSWPEFLFLYVYYLLRLKNLSKLKIIFPKRLENLEQYQHLYSLYAILNFIIEGNLSIANSNLRDFNFEYQNSILDYSMLTHEAVYHLLCFYADSTINIQICKNKFMLCVDLENNFAAYLYAKLIYMKTNEDKYNNFIKSSNFNFLDIESVFKPKQNWEYAIDKLESIITNTQLIKKDNECNIRILWALDDRNLVRLYEQPLLKNGKLGKITEVTTSGKFNKIIKVSSNFDDISQKALNHIKAETSFMGFFLKNEILLKLIGAPNFYILQKDFMKVELVKGVTQVNVTKQNNDYLLKINKSFDSVGIHIERESNNRLIVYNCSEQMVAITRIIGVSGINVPANSKDRILNLVSNSNSNNSIMINLDYEEEDIPSVNAINKLYVQFVPLGTGLQISTLFLPFAPFDQGYYYPAFGPKQSIVTTNDGIKQKVVRDFNIEQTLAQKLIYNCFSINNSEEFTFQLDGLEYSLTILEQIYEYKEKNPDIELQWPKGQSLMLRKKINHNNLHLKIDSKSNYFEYDGKVEFDDGKVLSMKSLLTLLKENPQKKFVTLDDGSYVAISKSLKSQLEELEKISQNNKVHNLSSEVLENIIRSTDNVELDKNWNKHLKSIEKRKTHNPIVPSTLTTQLRDYQIDGYKYLSRLANWNIGACLADDMGLGKTVQAIALILERANKGVTLIIAPTSVCFNWVQELEKFAPTLNVFIAYDLKDRKKEIDALTKMDVLICSYGLLASLENDLIEKQWNVTILDEAQAIKNFNTKRWSVVSKLNSDVRIALTGTPVENHLGELWSILHFLNPGLLGTLKNFQSKFILPISNSDQIAKNALKNIVKPYILRRTKTQVLTELPEKIEQSLIIELSDEEKVFYEAVKQQAVESIEKATNDNNRILILAQLSKLRQACCHSTLIEPSINIPNSKLNAFLELVVELKDNNHKVLVFSQFVRYLKIVMDAIIEKGISYKYIDGSTKVSDRKKAVDEFQSGEGDVFLISLKAGGTGLNLTAADYVIILDPWWNPAVEDQAADRAHRIGQHRPVTVYRLISKNTIEEKIVKLHKDKRDLAGGLLEGQDIGGKLSDEDLIALIK